MPPGVDFDGFRLPRNDASADDFFAEAEYAACFALRDVRLPWAELTDLLEQRQPLLSTDQASLVRAALR